MLSDRWLVTDLESGILDPGLIWGRGGQHSGSLDPRSVWFPTTCTSTIPAISHCKDSYFMCAV